MPRNPPSEDASATFLLIVCSHALNPAASCGAEKVGLTASERKNVSPEVDIPTPVIRVSTHESQYRGPGPLPPARSAGFASSHLSIERHPHPMHCVSPALRRLSSAILWSIRFVHLPERRAQSRLVGMRSAGSLASSSPISSSVSPILCAKTMNAMRRSTDRG